jgi:pimeloyl-ACP methyl ester carboxylesterase
MTIESPPHIHGAGAAPGAEPTPRVAEHAAVFESRTIDLGSPVHYADFGGSGPLMVLVHGIASSHLNWATIAHQLGKRFRVVAIDLPGFGLSRPAPEPAAVETSAKYLGRFIDAVSGGQAVTLFGHSMGGLVSLLEAGAHPERIARLILMAPAAPLPRRAMVRLIVLPFLFALAMPERSAAVMRKRGARMDAERMVRRAMKYITGPRSTVPEAVMQAHIDLVLRQRREHDWTERALVEAAGSLVKSTTRRRVYRSMVHQVTAPTLLLHGTKDRLVPYGAGRRLHHQRPDWTFQPMEGLGHMLQFEDPDWVLWTVNEWLDLHPVPEDVSWQPVPENVSSRVGVDDELAAAADNLR